MGYHDKQIKVFVFLLLVFTGCSIFSQDISPKLKLKTSGAITDFIIEGSQVILSTDAGTIETYNFSKGTKVNIFSLPESTDFMGDVVPTKVFSIDKFEDEILMVTQGNHGFRNVFIKKGDEQIKIIDADVDKMLVKKARFINKNEVLLGLMSNELILFNVEKKKIIYRLSISAYTFSDFSLSRDKHFVFTSDESGIVHKINVTEGRVVEGFSGNNVDNIYRLVYQNGTIITAGQDRRVGVYQTSIGDKYYLQKGFLVYCVGLNDDGTVGAFSADEENNIVVFDVFTKKETGKLCGHQSVVTNIKFIGNKILISASDDEYLMIWEIE